jgi:predicted nucleic acid-binding protein
MMNFVIDANIIFSGLLSGKKIYNKVFGNNHLFTPDFALHEIHNYQIEILKKTKLSNEQLKEFTLFIFSNLVVVPEFYINVKSREKAYDLCHDIDLKDIIYVALAIELGFVLITRDKALYNGLKSKDFDKVILFEDFLNEINK